MTTEQQHSRRRDLRQRFRRHRRRHRCSRRRRSQNANRASAGLRVLGGVADDPCAEPVPAPERRLEDINAQLDVPITININRAPAA